MTTDPRAILELREQLARHLHEKHGDWRRTWEEINDRTKDAFRKEADEIMQMVRGAYQGSAVTVTQSLGDVAAGTTIVGYTAH